MNSNNCASVSDTSHKDVQYDACFLITYQVQPIKILHTLQQIRQKRDVIFLLALCCAVQLLRTSKHCEINAYP